MRLDAVEQIVRATLYEGYMLYPYRPTSVKNQQRWNFGVLYPQAYCETERANDAWTMQTQCLVAGDLAEATLEVRVRFLHLIERQTRRLAQPLEQMPGTADLFFQSRDFLDESATSTWQEAEEQEVRVSISSLSKLLREAQRIDFSFPATLKVEPINDGDDQVNALIVRTGECLTGTLEVSAQKAGELLIVTVVISNRTPFATPASHKRDQALLRSLVSTHTILGLEEAEFVSLLDPPEEFRDAAAACCNVGCWPVLVGSESNRDTMLSSPIILYDYPQIAPESAGDLFDGTEIDEILTLRIMTLTDEEKREVRDADDRARKILERTELLPAEQLMKMHGAVRGLRRMKDEGRVMSTE